MRNAYRGSAALRRLRIGLALGVALGGVHVARDADAGCREECWFVTDCDQLSGDERWRCIAGRAGSSGDVCETVCRDLHGAIAYSSETGSWGYTYDYDSEARAGADAVRRCANYADDCRVVLTLVDQCGALAETANGAIGTGRGATQKEAEAQSLAACNANGEACTLVAWVCSVE
jgi:serine/threonine-protein kinase